MQPEDPTPRRISLDLPTWFWGGNPKSLADEADLRAIRHSLDGRWSLQTNESYFHRKPDLVSVRTLAGPGIHHAQFEDLHSVSEFAPHEVAPEALEALKEKRTRAATGATPVEGMSLTLLELMTCPTDQLGTAAPELFSRLRGTRVQGDPARSPFQNAGAHLMRRSRSLLWRVKLASILIQIEQDPLLREGHIGHLSTANEAGALAFKSASDLSAATYTMDAYLGPLLGALTPAVWAINAPRSFGSLIFSLGQPLAGTTGDASEFLQLVSVPGPTQPSSVPYLSPLASTSAINWWIERLNELFGVISNPCVFTTAREEYRPALQLQAVLSFEQLFRRITSAQINHRDVHARRVLLFTVLDTLDRVTNRNIERHCTLAFAEKTLSFVRDSMPPEAAEILLPGAERAVVALRRIQDGFFIRRQLGTADVQLNVAGDRQSFSPERAVALYVKTLRDATHGHGSNKQDRGHRGRALLAQHDGVIPHDLGLLGYLYLLEILCNPIRLKSLLHRGCRDA